MFSTANVPKSALLNHAVMILTQLVWAWNFILYQSFFQSRAAVRLPHCAENLDGVSHYCNKNNKLDSDECAVCLCRIEGGDEIRELSCDHAFHRCCIDRWLGYGHVTCPLCRHNVKPAHFTADRRCEVLMFDFASVESTDDYASWWLR